MGWLKYFIAAACVSVVVFFGAGSYFLVTTAPSEKALATQASGVLTQASVTLTHVNATVDQVGSAFQSAATSVQQTEQQVASVTEPLKGVVSGLQTTVTKINAECVPGPCGLLSNTDKLLNTTRLTVGQVEIAANNFDKNEAHFYAQEDVLFTDSDSAVKHFDTLISSKDLSDAIHNGSVITGNLGQTTGDFQTKFHAFLFPPPCHDFKCRLLKGYTFVRDASSLLEPTYYGFALAKGMTNP
jgi:hypothetical protein